MFFENDFEALFTPPEGPPGIVVGTILAERNATHIMWLNRL